VAIEIDGDPVRQDLDYVLAQSALAAGCLFALDSDAHTTAREGCRHSSRAYRELLAAGSALVVAIGSSQRTP
jgi:histidinol phosphatase-like PHP family hydrolase